MIMKDQTRRMRIIDAQKEVEIILFKVLAAFAVITLLAIVVEVAVIKNANASITGLVYDDLMSEEIAAFITLNPGEYEEWDMQ